MRRLKTAFFDLTGCEGCQLQLFNLGERLFDLLETLDLVEFREAISETWPGRYDLAFVEGSVTDEHSAERLRRVRERASVIVAFGSCAAIGGINGLRNALPPGEGEKTVYGARWRHFAGGRTRPIAEVVPVEYTLPGCPVYIPELESLLASAISGIPHAVPDHAVCVECRMNENVCVYDGGATCLGPVTRGGCDAWCVNGGGVCYGCRGMVSNPNEGGMRRVLEGCGLSPEEAVDRQDLYNLCRREKTREG